MRLSPWSRQCGLEAPGKRCSPEVTAAVLPAPTTFSVSSWGSAGHNSLSEMIIHGLITKQTKTTLWGADVFIIIFNHLDLIEVDLILGLGVILPGTSHSFHGGIFVVKPCLLTRNLTVPSVVLVPPPRSLSSSFSKVKTPTSAVLSFRIALSEFNRKPTQRLQIHFWVRNNLCSPG